MYKTAAFSAQSISDAALPDGAVWYANNAVPNMPFAGLLTAHQALARATNDFTTDNAQAKELDEALYAVLLKAGVAPTAVNAPATTSGSVSAKDALAAKIKGFETAMRFAKNAETKQALEAKIKGFKTALKFAK